MKKNTLLLIALLAAVLGVKAEVVYDMSHEVGNWNAQQLPLTDYSVLGTVRAGDVIAVTVTQLTGTGSHRITLQDAGWHGFAEQYISSTGVYYFVLSASNAAKIAGSGLVVSGENYTFDKVELLYKKKLWSGVLNGTDDWKQSDALDKSLFTSLTEGSVLGLTVSKINTGEWHNAVLRYNYESNIFDQGFSEPGTFLYPLTSGDVVKLGVGDDKPINLVARYLCITELNTYTSTIDGERPRIASLLAKDMNSYWPKAGEAGVTTGTSVSDNVITMGEYESGNNWGGAGYWLESSGHYFDATSYGKVVVRFSSATATNGGVNIKYKDNDNEGHDYIYKGFNEGTTEVVIELDAERKANFKEITIQGPQNAVFKVADIYFASSNYFALNETATPTISEVNNCYVDFTRSFVAGWNSLCLPFATTAEALGCKAYAFKSASATSNSVTFSEVSALEAGTPYLVYFDAAVSNLTFENVNITATTAKSVEHDGVTFYGTYVHIGGENKFGVLADGSIKQGTSTAYFDGYRAYFTGLTAAEGRVLLFDDDVTGISNVSVKTDNNNDMYTLSGMKVNGRPQKGIYIQNGKKYIVK